MWHKYVIIFLSVIFWPTISAARELPNCNAEMIVKWDFGVQEGNYPDATAFDVDGDNYPRGLAIDDKGYIYVGDGVHYELLKFSPTGTLVWKTQLQAGAKTRPELGHEITAVAIGPNYQPLVWNRSYERIEIYSEEGKFVRSFPISLPYTGNPSYDSLYVAKNGEVFACHDAMHDCTQSVMQLGTEIRVYSLEGKLLREIHDRMPTDSVTKVAFIGGNRYSIGAVYEPTGGRCITIQRDSKDVFSCLRAPWNRNLHHRFDAKGNLYFLLDNGIAKIQPDYHNGVILKDLPNYHPHDCEHKLDLSNMTMDKLIDLVFHWKVRNLDQEDPELRQFLLKEKPNDLRLLRNAVYARRSYKFKDNSLLNYFKDHFPEYKPIKEDAEHVLMFVDMNDVNYLREIEEIVLGKEIDEAYGGAKKRPERHGASKREIIDLTNAYGETWFRVGGFLDALYFPPKYFELMTGVKHLLIVYSPYVGYALYHTDNKSGDNKQGTNLWVRGLNKDTGFEFYTNKYAGQDLELDWIDEMSFSVKYRDSTDNKLKADTYRRENDKWYRKSGWKLQDKSN